MAIADSFDRNAVQLKLKKELPFRFRLERNWRCPIFRGAAGPTAITFQRGLNLNVVPDGPTKGRIVASAPFAIKNIKK
jgi:hypothetical protein